MVLQHNKLQDMCINFCHMANLGVKVEAGSVCTQDHSMSRPPDARVSNWIGGILDAFDFKVTSPVTSPLTPVHFEKQVSHLEQLHY